MVSYGIAPYVLGGFSKRSESVGLALSRLQPCGFHAASIDAVYYALNMLRRRNNHYRRAILLISEMRDQGSHAKLYDVVAELGITDTTIYTVAFSPVKNEFIDAFRYGNAPQKGPIFPPPKSQPQPGIGRRRSQSPEPLAMYRDRPSLVERLLPPQFMIMVNALKRNTAAQLAAPFRWRVIQLQHPEELRARPGASLQPNSQLLPAAISAAIRSYYGPSLPNGPGRGLSRRSDTDPQELLVGDL